MPEPLFLKIAGLRQTWIFMKKETLAKVLSCKFCEIFKNTFFTETLVAASMYNVFLRNT